MIPFDKKRQLHRILEGTSRVRRHQIGNQVLLLSDLLGQFKKALLKSQIGLNMWFSHAIQDTRCTVFRSNLELSTDMVLYQFPKEGVVRVLH